MWQWLLRLSDAARDRWRRRHLASHIATGLRGEDLAHRYLQKLGYTIVARNYRVPGLAELDLVARDGSTVVFVEVKTRSSEEFGSPDRQIDSEKREHLFRAAAAFLRRARLGWEVARFDVVNVVLERPPKIEHLRDVYPIRRQP